MATTNKVYGQNKGNFTNGGSYKQGKVKGLFLNPKTSPLVSEAGKADIKAALTTILKADSYNGRAHFVRPFLDPQNLGQDKQYETIQQKEFESEKGTEVHGFILEGTYSDYLNAKRLFEGKAATHNVVYVDENFVMMHSPYDKANIDGFEIHEIKVQKIEGAASGTVTKYRIRVALKDITEYENMDHTDCVDANNEKFNPFRQLVTVRDVNIVLDQEDSPAAGEFSIRMTANSGETNIAELYKSAAQLLQASAFKARMKAGGAALTIDSVAAVLEGDETIKFTLALDTADPDYSQGDPALISLDVISVIFGLINVPLESNTITVTLT